MSISVAGRKGKRERGEKGKVEMVSKADIEQAYAAIRKKSFLKSDHILEGVNRFLNFIKTGNFSVLTVVGF